MKHSKPSPGYENWLIVFPRGKTDSYFLAAEKNEDGTVTFSRDADTKTLPLS
jgi:hypothetical protein